MRPRCIVFLMDIHPGRGRRRCAAAKARRGRSKATIITQGLPLARQRPGWPVPSKTSFFARKTPFPPPSGFSTAASRSGSRKTSAKTWPPGQKRVKLFAGRPGLFGLRGPHRGGTTVGRHDDRPRSWPGHKSSLPRGVIGGVAQGRGKEFRHLRRSRRAGPHTGHRGVGGTQGDPRHRKDAGGAGDARRAGGGVCHPTPCRPSGRGAPPSPPRSGSTRQDAIARFFRTRSGIWEFLGGMLVAKTRCRKRQRSRPPRWPATLPRRRPTRKGKA